MKKFENVIKQTNELIVPDNANIIDFISELDKLYFSLIKNKPYGKTLGFHDRYIRSLLQLMWNPVDLKFYEDVGIGARSPEYKYLPVLNDWRLIIPDGSNLTITPIGED